MHEDEKKAHRKVQSLLSERQVRLNRAFEWTEGNKKAFVAMSDRLLVACDKGFAEMKAREAEIKKRIAEGDTFIKDYEVEMRIMPYPKLAHADPELSKAIANYWGCSMGDDHTEDIECYMAEETTHVLSAHRVEDDCILIDRSENWNIEWFGCAKRLDEIFAGDYICYAVHGLLDANWSFEDIISIRRVWVDVEVKYQYYDAEF